MIVAPVPESRQEVLFVESLLSFGRKALNMSLASLWLYQVCLTPQCRGPTWGTGHRLGPWRLGVGVYQMIALVPSQK